MSITFKHLTVEEEMEILKHDDAHFSNTRKYLDALIRSTLNRIEASPSDKARMYANLVSQIPLAAKRYLSGKSAGRDRLSVYFTWYISEELNKYD